MRDSIETNGTTLVEFYKKVMQLYKRRPKYLEVGDQFFKYELTDDFKEIIIGEVTGINNYRLIERYCLIDSYRLKFEANRGYEDITEFEFSIGDDDSIVDFNISIEEYEDKINNNNNKSFFDTKSYIPYDEDVVEYLIDNFMQYDNKNTILSEYISDNDDLQNIFDFLNKNYRFINDYFNRLGNWNVVDTMTIMEDLDDIEAVYGTKLEEKDLKVKMLIPGTLNKYLVLFKN